MQGTACFKPEQGIEMSIKLSASAVKHVKALMAENGLELAEHVVRVAVKAASGVYDYELDIEDDAKGSDRRFEQGDLTIVVDPRSYLHLKGTQVDFQGSGFTFANPNEG